MNDDQMITLLRDVPLPGDPVDRFAAVQARGRRQDRRRTTVLAASLAVVVIAGATTALTWKGTPHAAPQSLLSATTSAGSAHVVGTVDMSGQEQHYVGDIDFAHNAMSLTMAFSGHQVEIRALGDDIYLRGIDLGAAPQGKHWLHSTSDSASSGSFASFDPGRILDALRAKHATLTPQGHVDVNGEDTTDYLVTGAAGKEGDPFADGKGHVYVGGDGLVRRMTYNQPTFSSDSSGDHQLAKGALTTMDFSDYGKKVQVQAPPASDTYEESAAFQGSTTLTSSPQPLDKAARDQLCEQVKDQLAKTTSIPQDKKAELLKQVCGK